MKRNNIKYIIGSALIALSFSFVGCSDILDETPRSSYTVEYFKTENGVMSGLSFLYADLRYLYGQYYFSICETGTDEYTWAQSADANFKNVDMSGVGVITASDCRSDVLWNYAFPSINTSSAIIEYGAEAGIDNSLLAEAYFFRAFDYFMLVQTFGGVPLDLGAGELKTNDSPIRSSVRNTVPEVYTKAIFPDLLKAISDLPDASRLTGTATKTLARLYLSKAYLTYAWWLENPNSIPTYPTCDRTDPDGHDAAWYYQQAYSVAKTAIEAPGSFGLQDTYYDVNVGSNDRNNEILLYADHTENDEYYNGSSLSYSSGSAPDNFCVWFATWNYTVIRSSMTNASSAWTDLSTVQREADQHLGRPWTRMCPTIGVIKNTFADKTNDSRYDGTFTTVYRGNWEKNPASSVIESVYNANNMKVYPGEPILTFLDNDTTGIDYSNSVYKSNIGAGVLPTRSDFVVDPQGISRIVYPGLWKLGVYRTDNGTGLGQPNGASTRPYNIAKFSEFFFIAAEAAVKGASTSSMSGTYSNDGTARGLINVIRARAGKWNYDNNGNVAKTADNSAAMTNATPSTITIDYILAERSREYFGEGYRWYDLVRTQKWAEIAGSYQICGATYGLHTPETVTRTINSNDYLRPIPQGQLDAMEMTDAEKTAYQNPAYQ